MISMLDVDVRPGSGLGIFELGTSLWTVLDQLRPLSNQFPQVDVKFDPDNSCTSPILLRLRPHIDLLFSGQHQRLRTISVGKLRDKSPPVIARYKDSVLLSDKEPLRRSGVSKVFGPTYPGDDLRYPGVWFSFDEDGITDVHSTERGDDRSQEVKRIIVCQKGAEEAGQDVLSEVTETPIMNGEICKVAIKLHSGIDMYFYPTTLAALTITLGVTTAQDLTCDLGPPLRVYYKEDDRMDIHSTRTTEDERDEGYFYNYFQHGVDFLISSANHVVKKIILHTNIPGSPLFQRYQRCPWHFVGKPEDDEDESPPVMQFYEKLETITRFIGAREPTAPSMTLDRADDEGLSLPNSKTRLIGYDGVVLEVTDAAQVMTVMLF